MTWLMLAASLSLAASDGHSANGGPKDPLVAAGVRHLHDGEFEEAVFILDTAIRKLASEPGRSGELAGAYVYLGAAYVGLDHDEAAKGKFREALRLDPKLTLDAGEFPQRVLSVFETQRLKVSATRTGRRSRQAFILGGAGAAAGVGLALATRGGESTPAAPNRPPSGRIVVSPAGQAIAGVTEVSFTASATDPDGDALEFQWSFGDGATGGGESVNHVFAREGTFEVALTVRDTRGATVESATTVSTRSLSGLWKRSSPGSQFYTTTYTFTQAGAELRTNTPYPGSAGAYSSYRGQLSTPRHVSITEYSTKSPNGTGGPRGSCVGDVEESLNVITCVQRGLSMRFERQ